MAFKGRVLLNYASPQFSPAGNASRWQAAYDANKQALDYLTGKGKGLMDNYGDIWYQELNKEVIMVRRYAAVPAPIAFAGRHASDIIFERCGKPGHPFIATGECFSHERWLCF